MISIERRIRTSLILSLFVAFAALAALADYGVQQLSRSFVTTRLQHDSDNLIKALTLAPDRSLSLDAGQVPLIYQRVKSGHYFQILSEKQKIRSRSLWDRTPEIDLLPSGSNRSVLAFHGQEHWLIWEQGIELQGLPVTLWVAEDIAPFEQQWRQFSLTLYFAMAAFLILLVWLQRYLLKISFKQLRGLRQAIRQLQQGEVKALSEQAPLEIQPLTQEINHLLRRLEERISRSRTAMGNLAHELKRSLQQLHLLRDTLPESLRPDCDQALEQIKQLIDRELKRSRIAGSPHPGRRLSPHLDLPHLMEVLRRIYPDKELTASLPEVGELPYDRDDMLELIGNLLDNACKFSINRVQMELTVDSDCCILKISDDGPGIPQAMQAQLLGRGVRVDESIAGHGLGLSICQMIVDSYNGTIGFDAACPGAVCPGLLLTVTLPLRS